MNYTHARGYSLVELMVAVSLFAIIMMLSAGSYLVMINVSRQAQGLIVGMNNLSFALDTMSRTIRTGSNYCGGTVCASADNFTFTDKDGRSITYRLTGTKIQETKNGNTFDLTDASTNITSLMFYPDGTEPGTTDGRQARVSIVISGSVTYSSNKPPQAFVVETSATMRGTDL
jgi:prepilin-type N-terminal cleavage/methylation domain-containing protein